MTKRSEEEDELARRMQQVFCLMDTDDGGTITISEIESLMQLLGVDVSTEELEELISEVDADGSGALERWEFAEMMSHKPKSPNSMKEVFHCFRILAGRNDLGYGKIDHKVLISQMTKIGRDPMTLDEACHLTRQLEPLKDGTINFERYVLMTLRHNTRADPVPNQASISHEQHSTTQASTQHNRGPTECHVMETDCKIHQQFYKNIKRPDVGLARLSNNIGNFSPSIVQSQKLGASHGAPLSLSPRNRCAPKLKAIKDIAVRSRFVNSQKHSTRAILALREWG